MNKQFLAIVILVIFYSIYYIKQLLLKRKGIKVNQIKYNRSKLTVVMGVSNLLLAIVEINSIYMNTVNKNGNIFIFGIILSALGDIIFYLSVKEMGDNWRAGVNPNSKTTLVTKGIYQYSRNPAFLGFYLVYIGVMLMFYNKYLFIFTVLTITMLHFQITLIEEPYLKETFKFEYIIYQKQVNRYLGHKVRNW